MSATVIKTFLVGLLVLFLSNQLKAKDTPGVKINDSLTLAQAYVNLTLTQKYFDTLSVGRLNKILPFEEGELLSISDSNFIKPNSYLYNLSYSLLYFNKAKLLFKTIAKPDREALLKWKYTLEESIKYFNLANLKAYPFYKPNTYNEFIGFSDLACSNLKNDILQLKSRFTIYFNKNIYPDFQRIFYIAKNTGQFDFDSLTYYAGLYNLSLNLNILNNTQDRKPKFIIPGSYKIADGFELDKRLNLLSRYLQLDYMINGGQYKTPIKDTAILCESYWNFFNDLRSYYATGEPDSFFRREINTAKAEKLYRDLIKKYPLGENETNNLKHMALPTTLESTEPTRYYFPVPAPFPSAYLAITNYKPGLKTMGQVDGYFKNIFNSKGYSGHLHYYYVQSGFAVTTSLEKINKDGSPVGGTQRWDVSIGGNGSLSLYETFKSIFFDTESNFRIIGLVISPSAATVQNNAASIPGMQDLLKYSYPSLPSDLQNFSLPQKTLTVLIYDFHQSDVGEVPVLDVSKRLSARTHLERSGLGELLNNR